MGSRLGIFTRCSGSQFEFQALFATMTRLHHQKLTHVWYLPDRMASIGLGWGWVFCAGLTRRTDGLEASDVLLHFQCFHVIHIFHQSWISWGSNGTQSQLEETPSAVLVANRWLPQKSSKWFAMLCVCVYICIYILYPPPHDLPWVILDFDLGSSPWTEQIFPGMLDLGSRALLWDNCYIYIYNIYTQPLVSPPRPTPYRMETSIPFKMPWPTLIL